MGIILSETQIGNMTREETMENVKRLIDMLCVDDLVQVIHRSDMTDEDQSELGEAFADE